MNNNDTVIVPCFKRIVHFKRKNVRAGGVAVCQHTKDNVNIVTPTCL